jgi:hypothetical protein
MPKLLLFELLSKKLLSHCPVSDRFLGDAVETTLWQHRVNP